MIRTATAQACGCVIARTSARAMEEHVSDEIYVLSKDSSGGFV